MSDLPSTVPAHDISESVFADALVDTLAIRPEAGCGAWVEGISLADPLSDAQVERLDRALRTHGVLFFRDQEMTAEQHIAFARRFGSLYVSPYSQLQYPGHPEIFILTEADKGGVQWHSDTTFEQRPPFGVVLHAQQVPSVGGDTIWANMARAYEALSPAMQDFLLGKHAVHDFAHSPAGRDPANRYTAFRASTHPVITTDPVTGQRAIFVNELYTTRIVELSQAESDALLAFLFRHLIAPEFQVRLKWQAKTVAFWFNPAVQHYPVADYHEPRKMHRIVIELDAPPS